MPIPLDISIGEPSDPSYLGCWGDESDRPKTFGPIALSGDLVLTTVCGTLFAKDRQGELLWRHTIHGGLTHGLTLTDEPKMINGELVVIGQDLALEGLDPSTGERLWASHTNGRAGYAQTERYGKGMYLLLIDMAGYESGHLCREYDETSCPRTEPDKICLLRRDERLHTWSVPAGSRIRVKGNKIFAEYLRGRRYRRMELQR